MIHRDSPCESERLLAELLRLSAVVFSDKEIQEVQHFVDVGEYEIALETFVGIFAEEHKKPPPGISQLIDSMARHMDIDGSKFIQSLTELSKN